MISLTTKYALRAVQALEEEKELEFVPIDVLAERSEVARPYLAKVMKQLAAKGIIESKKGVNGGFRLPKDGRKITMLDICVALDDPVVRDRCFLDNKRCGVGHQCEFHDDWKAIRDRFAKFLSDTKFKA